ncbi:MAG: hydrogenase maturation protease [Streptomyces sp.]|nr:hydrogenase maturation protease [Streptomyces sp.]
MRERTLLAGARRARRRRGRGARLADRPGGPPGRRAGERGRALRRPGDRRDPDAAHRDADRAGEARGARHRPARRRRRRPGRLDAAGGAGAAARRGALAARGHRPGHAVRRGGPAGGARHPVVGPRRRPHGRPGHRPGRRGRPAGRRRQPGRAAPRAAPHRRAGPLPARPQRAGRGGAARPGRRGAPGGDRRGRPGRRHPPRAGQVPVLPARRGRPAGGRVSTAPGRTLVAGVGNVFLGDDGFGVAAVRRLASAELPGGVEVLDAGVRGVDLAYRLLDGYDTFVLVDATARGGAPGTLYVLDAGECGAVEHGDGRHPVLDAHRMTPDAVLALLGTLCAGTGGTPPGRVVVVGCEPASVDEGMGLSPAVEAAVPAAVGLVRGLVGAAAVREPAGRAHAAGGPDDLHLRQDGGRAAVPDAVTQERNPSPW